VEVLDGQEGSRRRERGTHLEEEERVVLDGFEELAQDELDELAQVELGALARVGDVAVLHDAAEELEDGRLQRRKGGRVSARLAAGRLRDDDDDDDDAPCRRGPRTLP